MKIYNRTKIPNEIIERVLLKASKGIGQVRTTDVVVKISSGQYTYSRGNALSCDLIKVNGKWIKTDGGRIKITLPADLQKKDSDPTWNNRRDFVKCASSFFETAKHEWSHVKDYQDEKKFNKRLEWSRENKNGKRPKWSTRPEEIRAQNYCHNADKKGFTVDNAYEEVMTLAIEIEKYYK